MLDWRQIDTLFLDMDGTLLDLHFDNFFWREHVPRRYAEFRCLELEQAKAELRTRYQSREGTLEWYCVDHWSQELELDIALLKEEVDHLIQVHPQVVDFLEAVAQAGKRRVLVTNAHRYSLTLKMEKTRLAGHFDAIVCAHDLGLVKEQPEFWPRLREREPFDPATTLLVDDHLAILRAARTYGIAHLVSVLRPDSADPPKPPGEFPAIRDFSELLPVGEYTRTGMA